jgi:hypothetical protein
MTHPKTRFRQEQPEETLAADLLTLASRYVELSRQLEETRTAMRLALANGAAGDPGPTVRPTSAPRRGRMKPQSPFMQAQQASAEKEELAILAYLGAHPGARTKAIVEATKAKDVTTRARLRRLRAQGRVTGGGEAGWTAAP